MAEIMTNTRDVIIKLKEVKKEKNLSLDQIVSLVENNNQFVSKTTVSRVFAKGSESKSFRYENTLRPIANALLDMETIEEYDDTDTQAYKSILKLKKDLIAEYEAQNKELKEELTKQKLKYHEKLATERNKFQKSLDFCREQISLKDKRIDQLLSSNMALMDHLLNCPYKKDCEK